MAYLIIDSGNTRVKVFVFEGDKIVYDAVLDDCALRENILKIFSNFHISKTIVSSVGAFSDRIFEIIKDKENLCLLSSDTDVPFNNLYGTPNTLGVDRIALVSAASVKYSGCNVLVIDAGTCITFDFINKDNSYLGGAISPGIQMRYKSLSVFTEKLPLLKFQSPERLIGGSTSSSIHSGVVNGVVAEVKGIIQQYEQQYENLRIVLTGGDMNYLSKRLKNSIFANPNFLAEGLNTILKHKSQE